MLRSRCRRTWGLFERHWGLSDNYDAEGCVDPPSILTANAIKDLRELISEYTSLHLDEICEWPVLDYDQSNI